MKVRDFLIVMAILSVCAAMWLADHIMMGR